MLSEKTLESPLHGKEIQPVHPKGNQSGIFTGQIHVEFRVGRIVQSQRCSKILAGVRGKGRGLPATIV